MPPLPNELVTNILEHADYKTVTACRRLCRRFKDIVDTTTSLRYIVELGKTGMCDGPPDAVGPAERLRKLVDSRAAWKNSVWSEPVSFPFSEDVFPDPWALSGNLVVFDGSGNGCKYLLWRFPSEARGIPEQLWYLDPDCKHIEAIALDDSQDLLIFSCLSHIHIRTLSSGCIHPLSSTLGLINSGATFSTYEIFYLCIQDDRLAFMTSFRRHSLVLVWDWKTGTQVAKIPCDYGFFTCSFLDRSSIIFPYDASGQQQALCFQVVTFESPNVTKEAALRYYHFELDALGPLTQQTYFHSMNTLPSNTFKSHFPGFFHSEPCSRILALEVETPTVTTFILGEEIPLRVHYYIPHDVFLGYIMSHPSDTDTVVVPWEAWGLGNAHIITLPDPSPNRILGAQLVCGMHATTEMPMVIGQDDEMMMRIIDCHPRRVANPVMQDTHLRLGGAMHSHEGLDRSSAAEWQEVCNEKIPYVFKDIPLPDGLRWENIKCMLGEDVVAVFEDLGDRIEKVFYHPI